MRNQSRVLKFFRWLLSRVAILIAIAALSIALPFLVVIHANWGLANITEVHDDHIHVDVTMPLPKARIWAGDHVAEIHEREMILEQPSSIGSLYYYLCSPLTPGQLLGWPEAAPSHLTSSPNASVKMNITIPFWDNFIHSRAPSITFVFFALGFLLAGLGYQEAFYQAREKYLQTVWPMEEDLASGDRSREFVTHLYAFVQAVWVFLKTLPDINAIVAYWYPLRQLS
ncbi:MAG: hypothetical protein K0U74_11985 [Alphaproteobacteria bacterium]|nr:hypothetical protein [Alphaproteobacteria bacterium]